MNSPICPTCPTCGSDLTLAPEGLCPACLVTALAATGSDGEPGEATPAGSRIGDHTLCGVIARGGMGIVYRARKDGLDREVALKMCLGGAFATASERARFRSEVEAVAQLDHPQIVPIYELGEHDGAPWFTMRLLDGGSLADRIASFRADPRAAARLVATLARAVYHAHQRGILHRDLKPSNVLLDANGRPCLADFGLARRIDGQDQLTATGQLLGSASYMAPEQARPGAGRPTTAVDVYGLGAILYELLAGRPPFGGPTRLDTLERVQREPALLPADAAGDRDLHTICHKCLEKEPARRYASALEVAQDLDRWFAGLPIHARRMTATESAMQWARSRPASLVLAALLVAGVGLGAVAGWQAWHQIGRLECAIASQGASREIAANREDSAWSLISSCGREQQVWYSLGLLWPAAQQMAEGNETLVPATVERVTFSDDGKILEVRAGLDVRFVDVTSVKLIAAPAHATFAAQSEYILPDDIRRADPLSRRSHGLAPYNMSWRDGKYLKVASKSSDLLLWNPWPLSQPGVWTIIRRNFLTRVGAVLARPGTPLLGSTGGFSCGAFSPRGDLLATGHNDGHIEIWDLETGIALLTLSRHTKQIRGLAWSPDGQSLAAVDDNGVLRVWRSGRPAGAYRHDSELKPTRFMSAADVGRFSRLSRWGLLGAALLVIALGAFFEARARQLLGAARRRLRRTKVAFYAIWLGAMGPGLFQTLPALYGLFSGMAPGFDWEWGTAFALMAFGTLSACALFPRFSLRERGFQFGYSLLRPEDITSHSWSGNLLTLHGPRGVIARDHEVHPDDVPDLDDWLVANRPSHSS